MAKIKYVTPQGRAKYPWLNKPDTQFSADGVYSTYLIMGQEEAAEFKQSIKDLAIEEFGAKAKYSVPIETDEETGDLVAKFKSNYLPTFVDSTGEVVTYAPALFAGSMLACGGEAVTYTVQGKKGVSLRLNFVQIIDPVGTSSGGGNPFGTVEGGFVKSDAPAAPTQAAPVATDGDDDDFDF